MSWNWELLLLWGTALSVVAVVATAIGVSWAVGRLPADYFQRPERAEWEAATGEPWYARLASLAKNVAGLLLVLLGLILMLAPGQGLLTVIAGLLLMNFPGKYRLERALVRRPGVMRALNWLRRRRGAAPFVPPDTTPARRDLSDS